MTFPESSLAHRYLDGLTGIEIGASAHNPFGLVTRNVDWTAATDTEFKEEERRRCGRTAPVDIVAAGDDLPLGTGSVDFVISSHVIEHFWDPLRALKEWVRVARRWVFLICPQPDALPADRGLPLTSWEELMDRHEGRTPPPENDDHRHWSRWNATSFGEMCRNLGLRVAEVQDPDDKVGNGFAVVLDAAALRSSPSVRRAVYWNVAAMNHWREVVIEQLGVLWRGGYRGPVKVALLAGRWEERFLQQCFARHEGIELELIHHAAGLDQFEFPAVARLEADCCSGAVDEVVYFHTKGVSQPGVWQTMMWRWLMNADLLTRAADPDLLAGVDAAGSSWCRYVPVYPHFAGNFWAARASLIRDLVPLRTFRAGFGVDPHIPAWMSIRHAAELWLGSARSPLNVRSWRAPDLVLHSHDFYTSTPGLEAELMAVHVPGNAVPANRVRAAALDGQSVKMSVPRPVAATSLPVENAPRPGPVCAA